MRKMFSPPPPLPPPLYSFMGVFSNYLMFHLSSPQSQIEVAMNVGIYHYDELFDYFEKLKDPSARGVVRFYYHYLKYAISPRLKYENYKRFKDGHLTYPYLQHSWVPNSIQT